MDEGERLSRYVGCMLGGAVGDALGAPVEFLNVREIAERYGGAGIEDFQPWGGFPAGSYTDDTQLALATAVGIIRGRQRFYERGVTETVTTVWEEYKKWRRSQRDPAQRRVPDSTCLASFKGSRMPLLEEPPNNSRGCAAVTRMAPIGLAFAPAEAFRTGAECAVLSHGHPTAVVSAGMFAAIISLAAAGIDLRSSVAQALSLAGERPERKELSQAMEAALSLAGSTMKEAEAIDRLGQGWVAVEALSIGVYCAQRFSRDFQKAVRTAVNHSGDSDSTAALTGSIAGACLGLGGIGRSWIERVENTQTIQKVARDIYLSFREGRELSHEEYPGE